MRVYSLILLCLLASCGGGGGGNPNIPSASAIENASQNQNTTSLVLGAAPDTDTPATCNRVTAATPSMHYQIDSLGINYPALVRSIEDPTTVLIFTGNFSRRASAEMLATTPAGDATHLRYPRAQEEIWVAELNAAKTDFAQHRRYAVGIQPETPVERYNGLAYNDIYPSGFSTDCYDHFQAGQCNVQIDDPSVITYSHKGETTYFLYFTLFENYRWWSPLLGSLDSTGPENPATQNIHAIGLAVSQDGRKWTFIDKVVLENELDSDGTPILGAWSPSAIVNPHSGLVDVYFHDSLGTKQYVAHFSDGMTLLGIDRLNKHDLIFRVNLDVIFRDGEYEVMYNTHNFSIAKTAFTQNFGVDCPESIVIKAKPGELFPTPHQFINDDGKLHLYYWDFHQDEHILVNVYD